MSQSMYYRIGPVETTNSWVSPISLDKVNAWIGDFMQLDFGDYKVYLGGKYTIDPMNTDDVDICITGPIYDYKKLYDIMVYGYELAFNKHNFFVDIKHFDNIHFAKYPKVPGFKRYHVMTELAGLEQKIIDGKVVYESMKQTAIQPSEFIPQYMAVNVVMFPMDKQIEYGKVYDLIPLN